MRFLYVAYTINQGIIKGRAEGRSETEAKAEVSRQGFKLLSIVPARKLPEPEDLFPSLFHVGSGELIAFCRQMATILESGGNMVRGLELLQRETRNRVMRRTLESVLYTLHEGKSLSAALNEHPSVFSPVFISVVEVGEHTGRLGTTLEQMADILNQEHAAKRRAMAALVYPAAIIGLAMVTLVVLMVVAVPQMLRVFESLGSDVPLMTRIMLGIFSTILGNFPYLLAGAAALVALFMLVRSIPRVRFWMAATQTRMPLLGGIIVSAELSRFSRTISILLSAGLPLASALRLAISGCKNELLRRAFSDGEQSLVDGHGLAPALRSHAILPPMFVELMTIGEESNSLQRTMQDAAQTYENQLNERVNKLLALLEPLSTLIVGLIVGLIAFSMFIPIYSGLDTLN